MGPPLSSSLLARVIIGLLTLLAAMLKFHCRMRGKVISSTCLISKYRALLRCVAMESGDADMVLTHLGFISRGKGVVHLQLSWMIIKSRIILINDVHNAKY